VQSLLALELRLEIVSRAVELARDELVEQLGDGLSTVACGVLEPRFRVPGQAPRIDLGLCGHALQCNAQVVAGNVGGREGTLTGASLIS